MSDLISSELVDVPVPLTAETVLALTEIAAGLGMTPAGWLASQARAVTLDTVRHKTVVRLYMRGLCDAEIARELNLTNQQVATKRRVLGLPANRRANGGRVAS